MLVTRSFQAFVRTPRLCVPYLAWKEVLLPTCIVVSWKQQPLSHQKFCPDNSDSKSIHDWGIERQKQAAPYTFIAYHHCLLALFILWLLFPKGILDYPGLPGTTVAIVAPTVCPRIQCFMSSHLPHVGSQHWRNQTASLATWLLKECPRYSISGVIYHLWQTWQ